MIRCVAGRRCCRRWPGSRGPSGQPDAYDSLPPALQDEARAGIVTAESLRSYFDEFLDGSTASAQAGALVDLAGKPLIVLTAGQGA